jgi:hypothetical protein
MTTAYLPVTREIRSLFAEEIAALGGTILDAFDDGRQLFARAVLPRGADVLPNDWFHAGVAMRVVDDEVLVHPYTLRQVCKNGAIAPQALETRRVERAAFSASCEAVEEVMSQVRETVHACASEEVFSNAAAQMRSAAEMPADAATLLMPMMAITNVARAHRLYYQVVDEFEAAGDSSVYGLMNAVTAIARDESDPETRWPLEELGGGVPARIAPRRKPSPCFAEPGGKTSAERGIGKCVDRNVRHGRLQPTFGGDS